MIICSVVVAPGARKQEAEADTCHNHFCCLRKEKCVRRRAGTVEELTGRGGWPAKWKEKLKGQERME